MLNKPNDSLLFPLGLKFPGQRLSSALSLWRILYYLSQQPINGTFRKMRVKGRKKRTRSAACVPWLSPESGPHTSCFHGGCVICQALGFLEVLTHLIIASPWERYYGYLHCRDSTSYETNPGHAAGNGRAVSLTEFLPCSNHCPILSAHRVTLDHPCPSSGLIFLLYSTKGVNEMFSLHSLLPSPHHNSFLSPLLQCKGKLNKAHFSIPGKLVRFHTHR